MPIAALMEEEEKDEDEEKEKEERCLSAPPSWSHRAPPKPALHLEGVQTCRRHQPRAAK